ncbi:MAG: basic amino acid/polyamine antiporter [Aeromonadaceae bacterium]|nr:basic amino acid/polyamine antiporter [Aeromonadaceae bacterium]
MRQDLGLGALVALVFSSMVGAGIFSLPQNMAQQAQVGAIALGWLITGAGMLALACVYQRLALRRPDLDGGIFTYARAGFGDFIGFNAAWGYWVCQLLANVSYVVVLFSALSYFTDRPGHTLLGEGNTPLAIALGSVLVWGVHLLILKGVRRAALVNLVATLAKLIPLLVLCVALLLAFHLETFRLDVWGEQALGGVLEQVTSTMKVTLWVFIGIEGAVVVSARARRRQDVGRATLIALLGALALYVMVSLFALGVMSQPEVAALKNPSTAAILAKIVGPWGAWLINIGMVISVLGAFLSWTLLASEVPFIAAQSGLFPRWFSRLNQHGTPAHGLWATTLLVQLFLLVILLQESTYLALVNITTSAALVPYFFSAAYGLKLAWQDKACGQASARDLLLGAVATGYGLWLVYAAGVTYLLLATLLYVPGLLILHLARRQQGLAWGRAERLGGLLLVCLAAWCGWSWWQGWLA